MVGCIKIDSIAVREQIRSLPHNSWFPSPRFPARSTTTRTRRRASSSRWSPNALLPPPPHSIPIPGRSSTRNVATAFPTITARWLNDGGVLAGQADFGERASRDFCGTYVRRCVDMGGAGDRASFGQAEVHTQRTAWGAGLLHERRPRTKCDPWRACLFCDWRRFDDVR